MSGGKPRTGSDSVCGARKTVRVSIFQVIPEAVNVTSAPERDICMAEVISRFQPIKDISV